MEEKKTASSICFRLNSRAQIPPLLIQSPSTYSAVLMQPCSPYHLRLILPLWEERNRPVVALRFRPLAGSSTRQRRGWASATLPWRQRRASLRGEMLSKHCLQSANVALQCVGDGLYPMGDTAMHLEVNHST